MKGRIIDRWRAWRALDDGAVSGGESPEARLDARLRTDAAALRSEVGDGRMRWRVLEAVSAQPRAAGVDRTGRIGVSGRAWAVAACLLLAAGAWFTMRPMTAPVGPAASPGDGPLAAVQEPATPTPTVPPVPPVAPVAPNRRVPPAVDSWIGGLRMTSLQHPVAALAARLDEPFKAETERLVSDARRMAGAWAQRVISPIAALHRGGEGAESLRHQEQGPGV